MEAWDTFTDPLSTRFATAFKENCKKQYWYEANRQMENSILNTIDQCSDNTFAFFHVRLPHGPFIFGPDGEYQPDVTDVVGYKNHLSYLDQRIGRVVDHLRKAKKNEKSMLIITSDHGWRGDPDYRFRPDESTDRRVPLIMKFPNQREKIVVHSEVNAIDMGIVLRRLFAESSEAHLPEQMPELVELMTASDNSSP